MKLRQFLHWLNQQKTSDLNGDLKLLQFLEDVEAHPEIGDLDMWSWFRAAFIQVPCPCCIGHEIKPDACLYCGGTGKVDYHLVSHPMNVYYTAELMEPIHKTQARHTEVTHTLCLPSPSDGL